MELIREIDMAEADTIRLPTEQLAEPPPATSRRQVQSLMVRIGKLLRRRFERKQSVEAKMRYHQQQLQRLGSQLSDSKEDQRMRGLADRIYGYCSAHQEELERDAGGRTVSFKSGGKFSWRDSPVSLEVTDEGLLLESIRKARLTRELVTYEPKIDLSKLRKNPELLKRLKGIRKVERTMFRIEPPETDERLETEAGSSWPRRWVIRQPRSRVFA